MTTGNLFVRISYDMDSIKEASIWKICLTDNDNHIVYIETLHECLSANLKPERYNEMNSKSYFKGLTGVDSYIGKLQLVNDMDKSKSEPINIFVDSDIKILEKIKSYIETYLKDFDRINIVFKNSFEEVLFMDFIKDTLKDYNIITTNITNILLDSSNNYEKICEESYSADLESLKDNKEMYTLLTYLKIVIENLILKDFFTYIIK